MMKAGSILNYFRKAFIWCCKSLVTGAGIRAIFKKIWGMFWKEVDRVFGFFAREIYKRTVEIVPNKVFFFTQEMRYGCNPKYICEELKRRNENVEIVWRLPSKGRGGVPKDVRGVRVGSFEYYKELYSSAIVVANSYIFLDQVTLLKKEQVLIQTWHGSLGIKRFGKSDMKGHRRQRMASILTGKMTDYCITNSSFVSSSLRNTFWPNTPMLEYGHPRNDIFFEKYAEERGQLKKRIAGEFTFDENARVVMYAPTFRDAKNFDCYNIDFNSVEEALRKKFGGEWVILLKFHPSMSKIYGSKLNSVVGAAADSVIDVTKYPDMQELVAITDVAITDYSSWIYDFMLSRKPGFIFATDIDLYNNERGFCYPLETTPFSIARNNEELINAIYQFDEQRYLEHLEFFLQDKGCIEDGHASERVVDKIFEIIKEKQRNM